MTMAAIVFAVCIVHLLSFAQGNTSEIAKPEQAQGFSIFYGPTYKVVENFISNSSYILIQGSSKMPSRNHCNPKLKSFSAPLANYSLDTTRVPVSFLELLGVLDGLKGVASQCTTSACLIKYIADGDIKQIDQGDPEQILQFSAYLTSSSVALAEQQCNYITFDPLEELKPLQRAEWIKYLGAVMESEARANKVFKMVEENYLCLSALAMNASTKPTIAWMTFDKDTWYFSNETYKLQYVLDAGGLNLEESVYTQTFNMSVPCEAESFRCVLSTVNVIIDESYAAVPSDYTLSSFIENANISEYDMFPFMNNESVWRYDKQIESSCTIVNDWFDLAIAQPQLVLGDLIQALHPEANYTTTFLRNIAKGQNISMISSEQCAHSISTSMEPILISCNDLVIK